MTDYLKLIRALIEQKNGEFVVATKRYTEIPIKVFGTDFKQTIVELRKQLIWRMEMRRSGLINELDEVKTQINHLQALPIEVDSSIDSIELLTMCSSIDYVGYNGENWYSGTFNNPELHIMYKQMRQKKLTWLNSKFTKLESELSLARKDHKEVSTPL